MADVIPLKLDPSTGMVKQFTSGDTISTTIAPGSGGGGSPVVIRPSQITADENNYSPTDWATATLALLTSNDFFRIITGFSATGVSDGEVKTLQNVGSYPIVFLAQSTSSTAANRVNAPGHFILFPGRGVSLIYDSTNSRWAVNGWYDPAHGRSIFYQAAPGSSTAADWGNVSFQNNLGSINNTAATLTIPRQWRLNNAGATSGYTVALGKTAAPFYLGGGWLVGEAIISTGPNLSDATTPYDVTVGFALSFSTDIASTDSFLAVGFKDGVNGGKFVLRCSLTGTYTDTDLGITPAADTIYKIRIEVNSAGTQAFAWIDDVFVGMVAPVTFPNIGVYFRAGIYSTSGPSNRQMGVHNLMAFQLWKA